MQEGRKQRLTYWHWPLRRRRACPEWSALRWYRKREFIVYAGYWTLG